MHGVSSFIILTKRTRGSQLDFNADHDSSNSMIDSFMNKNIPAVIVSLDRSSSRTQHTMMRKRSPASPKHVTTTLSRQNYWTATFLLSLLISFLLCGILLEPKNCCILTVVHGLMTTQRHHHSLPGVLTTGIASGSSLGSNQRRIRNTRNHGLFGRTTAFLNGFPRRHHHRHSIRSPSNNDIFVLRASTSTPSSSSSTSSGNSTSSSSSSPPPPSEAAAAAAAVAQLAVGEMNYYQMLEVSPDATHTEIRKSYVRLARVRHPDAMKEEQTLAPGQAEFYQIAEAWSVLSDPKERLKYDRQLRAKDLTDTFGDLIEVGFRFTFNTIRDSSKTITKTATDLDKTVKDVTQRVEKARVLNDLYTESRNLRRKAELAAAESAAMKKQLETDRRHQALKDASSGLDITSLQARQIRKTFKFLEENRNPRSNDDAFIAALEVKEVSHREMIRMMQDASRTVRQAQDKVENARTLEQRGRQKLEEAQRALEVAQANLKQCEVAEKEAVTVEKKASMDLGKAYTLLEQQKEKTRLELKRREEENLKLENAFLNRESVRLDDESKRLHYQAKIKYDEAEALSRAQEKERN